MIVPKYKRIVITLLLAATIKPTFSQEIIVGAERMDQYLQMLKGKSIGLLVNHTSLIKDVHLLDTLLKLDVGVKKIFSPEHGFRGDVDAGKHIDSGIDERTGLPIVSLYGKNLKPKPKQLEGIDLVIFDIQDVGTRFYTYISTMHYMMELCAKMDVPFMVLDRPNPNGDYVDGPVLDLNYQTFAGTHPIPIVHGLTVGELARMINGEKWLEDNLTCDLEVIKMQNWNHNTKYSLPVKPSPNLPNRVSIRWYPSLCLFEGTVVSVGRGTEYPFQIIGHPQFRKGDYTFLPKPTRGAQHPKLQGEVCNGYLFENEPPKGINLQYLIDFYENLDGRIDGGFFTNYFNNLAGNATLKHKIRQGWSASEIKESWQDDLTEYNEMRKKYLLYPDFK